MPSSLTIPGRALAIFLVTVSAFTVLIAQDKDEISVDSSIVVLNAVVRDANGSPVKGLTAGNFNLTENGVRQEIDFVDSASTPFAAVILLDISGSMRARVSLARSAAIRFLRGIRPTDNVAIYSFDRQVELVQDFSNSRDVRSRIFDLEAKGYTSLNDAIFKASEELTKRKEKRRAIIVLSDGEDTRSRVSASKALKAAQNADATIYTVDMSSISGRTRQRQQNRAVLKRFAEKTGGRFVTTPGGIALRKAFGDIVFELGQLYTLGYYSSDPKQDGKWREISLETGVEGHTVRTRAGYYAEKAKKSR